ncbi:hypothetical protein [Halomonas alimentaria]|uniref:Uncharacterized protein n=1 Tax=Halomonas alimentaria TaxID=147248 RepID=A0A7X4W856_9GAMM|nr:hypothetical protein [Halomonas alimentaria]NAW35798.1 hypothetical protein [Halomonas alimentaria]
MNKNIVLGICAITLSFQVWAQDWSKMSSARDDNIYYQTRSGDKSLMLGCLSGEDNLSFTLIGGDTPLHQSLHHNPSLIVWITLPDGRTGRYAIDTEYMGGMDNALIGRLLLGEEGKQFFAQGAEMEISSPQAGVFFRTGMIGSARAMQDFRTTCRL